MIQLLDCTLRDGCHVNSGDFGNKNIIQIANGLTNANVDIVELGFLRNVEYDKNKPFYSTIEKAYEILSKINMNENVEYALMVRADEYNLDNLTNCNGKIKYIRIAFYYDYLENAIKFAKEVQSKGYKITLNLINTPGNTINDLSKLIDYANDILPEVVTIVDTFGVLDQNELLKLLNEYDTNLDKTIKIGLHVHENLALSFSLAKIFINTLNTKRNIIVDGSLMGMGRIPGNLCIELIADYLNVNYEKQYNLQEFLTIIDRIISPIKNEIPWGYSPAYFLSAKYRVHRSYSECLLKQNIPLDKINHILNQIELNHSEKFDENYLKKLIENNKGSI